MAASVMTRKDQITLLAGMALLAVIHFGDRSWMPPSGLRNAIERLSAKTSLPKLQELMLVPGEDA